MGVLPLERLKSCSPFSAVGIDYFEPYTIKGEVQKRVRGKCYGVIFACMTSRAVHVDVSQDYSTDAFCKCYEDSQVLEDGLKDFLSQWYTACCSLEGTVQCCEKA